MRCAWTREEVDTRLHEIMKASTRPASRPRERFGTPGNYVNGANIAGFLKVADAMLDQGLVVRHESRSGRSIRSREPAT